MVGNEELSNMLTLDSYGDHQTSMTSPPQSQNTREETLDAVFERLKPWFEADVFSVLQNLQSDSFTVLDVSLIFLLKFKITNSSFEKGLVRRD